MIQAIIFDLDNTLVDFMRMKNRAIEAAIKSMIDAGLNYSYGKIKKKIDDSAFRGTNLHRFLPFRIPTMFRGTLSFLCQFIMFKT